MKKLPFFPLLFVFLVPVIIGFSILSTPFALIDDSRMINISKEFITQTQKGNFGYLLSVDNPQEVKPVYHLAYHLPYILKGQDSFAFHFFHLMLFAASSVLIFLIIFTLTESGLAGIIASLGYLFNTSTLDTWTRLGLSEPLLVFFLLLAILNLVKIHIVTDQEHFSKKKFTLTFSLCLISLFLADFTKETAIAIIPPLIILTIISLISVRKFSLFIQSLIAIILFQTFFSLTLFIVRNLQGTNFPYVFTQEFALKNYHLLIKFIQKDFGYLFPISIFIFFILLIKKSKDLRHKTSIFKAFCLFFLALSASFLIAESTSVKSSNLFLSPFFMAFFLFIGCSLSYLFSILKRMKKSPLGRVKALGHLIFIVFIFYCLVFFYFQIKEAVITINDNKDRVILHAEMVKTLSKNLFPSSKIYFVIKDENLDFTEETKMHLKFFYNKENSIGSLNPNLLPPLNNGDLIVVSLQYPKITDNLLNQILSRKTLLYHSYLWTIYKIER